MEVQLRNLSVRPTGLDTLLRSFRRIKSSCPFYCGNFSVSFPQPLSLLVGSPLREQRAKELQTFSDKHISEQMRPAPVQPLFLPQRGKRLAN